MKKLISTIIFCWIFSLLYSQEFSTTIYFSDNVGNTDSIIVGYDPAATDSVDTAFGEVNIIDEPWDSVFDVRIVYRFDAPINYHFKKNIIEATCSNPQFNDNMGVGIHCENWPVTAWWDSSDYDFPCRRGSVFTSVPPGGWWDVSGISDLGRAELAKDNNVTFSMNAFYTIETQDTISVFWVGFGDTTLLTLSRSTINKQTNSLNIYPNPFTGNLISLDYNIVENKIARVELIDRLGRVLYTYKDIEQMSPLILTLPDYLKGVYFFKIYMDKEMILRKIIKL